MFASDVPTRENPPEAIPVLLAKPQRRMGQALVEYALIMVLVSLAIMAILTATGPAIGNVFSNVVYNLLGETSVPYSTLDSNQFWTYVTAVAQYKPDVSAVQTNTAVGYATPTPLPPSTAGPSPDPTLTLTPTSTPTVGPSPTPVDISYSIPFVDTADESAGSTKWHYQFTDAFAAAPWTVRYFNGATYSTGNMSGSAPNSAYPCTTNLLSAVACFSDVNTSWVAAPAPGIVSASGWGAQYIYTPAPFEGREYQVTMQLGPNDAAVLKIGPSVVASLSSGQSVVGAYNQLITPYVFQIAAGSYPVEVDFYAGAGSSHSVKLNFSTLADTGTCTWGTLNPGHSPNLSWQNANGGNYAVTSNCNLRLRGSIDLGTASSGSARLTFFDKWNISSNAVAYLGVRNYNFTSNNDWTWVPVHTGSSQGNNWAYQYYDLSKFGSSNTNFMTGNKKVEIAFRVQNNDPSVTAQGWFVDDITVEDNTVNTYTVPVSDNMDTPSVLQWKPTCNWAVTSEKNYPSGVGHSWSDSPSTTYSANSDCSLYLNGVIDLTPYGPTNSIVPQLLFYNQIYTAGTIDVLTVEYAPIANRNAWTALTPFGSVNPWVAKGTANVGAWTLETFNLNTLLPDKYYFRFRFVSDSTTPTAGMDGWYIDNIQWRERPLQAVGIPFAETFSNSDNWTMSDNWGLTTLATAIIDGSPHQTDTYSLADSPNGAMYVAPSTGSTNTAQYTPQIIMSSASPGFNPVIQFWTRWDIATQTSLYLEGSTDGGITFNPTPLWSYSYGQASVSPFDTSVGTFNTNKAWTRYVVPLKNVYTGWPCGTTCVNLTIRFRLTAATTTTADGIFIGDLAVYDANIYNQSFTNSVACQASGICNPSPQVIATNPFSDNFESGVNNWYVGGDWALNNTVAHSGTYSFAATTNTTASRPENALLEIAPTFDFTGVTKPVVSFWTKYAIDPAHKVSVEASTNGGTSWNAALTSWITQPDQSPPNTKYGTNQGWTRQVMDLSGMVSVSSEQLRIRFRLNALTNNTGSLGWWLDDVYVGPLASLSGYNAHSMDYTETFGNLNNVVAEGDWQSITDWGPYDYTLPTDNFQPVNYDYGNGQLNPVWDANYYHYYPTDPNFPTSGSGNSWVLPTSAQMCGSAPLYGSQISDITTISGTTSIYTDATIPSFSYTDGYPNNSAGSETGIKTTAGIGKGFQFTVTAGTAIRTLNVYVGVLSSSGSSAAASIAAQLQPPGTPGSGLYGTQQTNKTLSTTNTTTPKSKLFTITYNAAIDGQLLDIKVTNFDANGYVILEGAYLTASGSTSTTASLSSISVGSSLSAATPVNLTSLTPSSPSDYAHWGATGGTGSNGFVDKTQAVCVKPLYHQQEAIISHTWDSTHIPVNAANNASWTTNASDYTYFVASYTRKYTITTAGTYRFWSQADDGVRFLVDGNRVLPTPTTGGTALPFPWKSAGNDDWVSQAAYSYFYQASLTSGVHTLEVDYFQGTGAATLQFQGSEQTTMLHSNSQASTSYTANQDTGAYTSGYITIPASTTQTTTLSFYERYAVGSTSSSSDPMYVAISTDGGFTWMNLNSQVQHIILSGNTSSLGTVTYGYNLSDSSAANSSGSQGDPFVTYQNWQLHTVNLSNLKVNATAPYINTSTGTPLISTTASTNIMIKFELNATASTNPGLGWYITNLNVIQQ
jgi:Flp pilus assembly pilin Flp